MTVYTLTPDRTMVGDGNGRFVLVHADNSNYQDILAEVEAGTSTINEPASLPILVTYQQFRALFTGAENAAIMTAAVSNPAIMDWILQAAAAPVINLGDQTVVGGLAALVAAGLLKADRKSVILANQAP